MSTTIDGRSPVVDAAEIDAIHTGHTHEDAQYQRVVSPGTSVMGIGTFGSNGLGMFLREALAAATSSFGNRLHDMVGRRLCDRREILRDRGQLHAGQISQIRTIGRRRSAALSGMEIPRPNASRTQNDAPISELTTASTPSVVTLSSALLTRAVRSLRQNPSLRQLQHTRISRLRRSIPVPT